MNKNRVLANVKVDYQELKAQVNFGLVMIKGLIAEYNGQKNYGCVLRLMELVEDIDNKIKPVEGQGIKPTIEGLVECDDLILVHELVLELLQEMRFYIAM